MVAGACDNDFRLYASRLGADTPPNEQRDLEDVLVHVERATDRAAEAVAEASSEAIRLRRALDAPSTRL